MTSSSKTGPIPIASSIRSVTLFTNQAQVTRQATLPVQQGLQNIWLDVNAFNIDCDSVSAKVMGQGEIYSVQLREVRLAEAPQENIRRLDKKIEEKTFAIQRLQKKFTVIDQRDSFLGSIIRFSQTQTPQDLKTAMPNVNQLEETLGFIEKNAAASNDTRQELEIQMAGLQKELDLLGHERQALCGNSNESKQVVEVLFNAAKEQEITLEVQYVVFDAGWQPFYKINIPADLSSPSLTLFSRIMQQTGEDWLSAKLAISNVIPLQGIGLPDQGSWILDVYRPQPAAPKRRESEMHRSAKSAPEDFDVNCAFDEASCEPMPAMAAAGAPEAGFMEPERTELPLAFEYALPQSLDIASQDTETLLPLFTKNLTGDFFYRVVPQSSNLAFLVCRTQSDGELLSGYLHVHFGGRYIGKTYLEEKKPGEDFQFSLGADRMIKVKRELKKDKVKETLLGMVQRQSVVREINYVITLENMKDQPVQLEVLDSIPVSRTDKIEVKDIMLEPKPITEKYQNRPGVLQWQLELKPGEKKEITIQFTTVYPNNLPITGLM